MRHAALSVISSIRSVGCSGSSIPLEVCFHRPPMANTSSIRAALTPLRRSGGGRHGGRLFGKKPPAWTRAVFFTLRPGMEEQGRGLCYTASRNPGQSLGVCLPAAVLYRAFHAPEWRGRRGDCLYRSPRSGIPPFPARLSRLGNSPASPRPEARGAITAPLHPLSDGLTI